MAKVDLELHARADSDGIPIDSVDAIRLYCAASFKKSTYDFRFVHHEEEEAYVLWDGERLMVSDALGGISEQIPPLPCLDQLTQLEEAVRLYLSEEEQEHSQALIHAAMEYLSGIMGMDLGCVGWQSKSAGPVFENIHEFDIRLYGIVMCIRHMCGSSWLDNELKIFCNLDTMTHRFVAFKKEDEDVPRVDLDYEDLSNSISKETLPNAISSVGSMFLATIASDNNLQLPTGVYVLKDFMDHQCDEKNVFVEDSFQSEVVALIALRYPFIVKLIACAKSPVVQSTGRPPLLDLSNPLTRFRPINSRPPLQKCFLLEYVGGGSVEAGLMGLNFKRTLAVAKGMGVSLHMVHTHFGVPYHHGDVHLRNFCMTNDLDMVKLLDFGYFGPDAGPIINGISAYSEPGGVDLDWKSDVYAFGMCLIRLMTGLVIKVDNGTSVFEQLSTCDRQATLAKRFKDLDILTDAHYGLAENYFDIAILCITGERAGRPCMHKIVDWLHDLVLKSDSI